MNNIFWISVFVFHISSVILLRGQEVRSLIVSGRGGSAEAAYTDAREQALKQCGIRLLSTFSEIRSGSNTGSTVSRQFYLAGIASGMILHEDTIKPAARVSDAGRNEKPLYEATLRVQVKQLAPEDPYFQLTLKLLPDKAVFRNNEKVALEVQATKDCFLTVFCLGADNRLYLIYPYVTQTTNFLKAHTVFPVNGLSVGLIDGSNEASEAIIAVATKGNFPFIDFSDTTQWQRTATQEGQFLAFRIAGAATKLTEWLGTLGEDQWTIARLPYSIIK